MKTMFRLGKSNLSKLFCTTILCLLFSNCASYLSSDLPLTETFPKRSALSEVGIHLESGTDKADLRNLYDIIVSELEKSNLFNRIRLEKVPTSKLHLKIYSALSDTFEDKWLFGISTFLSATTLGIIPAIKRDRRVMIVEYYWNKELLLKKEYSHKFITVYGLMFFLEWEKGIQDADTIAPRRDANLFLNAMRDLPEY